MNIASLLFIVTFIVFSGVLAFSEVSSTQVSGAKTSIVTASDELKTAEEMLGAKKTLIMTFENGNADLLEAHRKELKAVFDQEKSHGKIKNVQVLTWADREYPGKNEKASSHEINLAYRRGEQIKNFLRRELSVSQVDVYNMAKRPNAIQDLLKTSAAKIKGTMVRSGSAPTYREDSDLFQNGGQSSKAVVFIYL